MQILAVEQDFLSYQDYLDYTAEDTVFESLAVAQHAFPGGMRVGDTTHAIVGQMVSGNYFSVLGAQMALGRGLDPDDNRTAAAPVAVVSHLTWRQRFGGDPAIVGRVIHLSGNAFTVVGVASTEFVGSLSSIRADVWVPIEQWALINRGWGRVLEDRDFRYFLLYGRLRSGVAVAAAQAAIDTVAARLDEAPPVIAVDFRVLGFALLIAVVAGSVAGWLPARRAARGSVMAALHGAKEVDRSLGRVGGSRDLLVSVQVAVSVVLLVLAGLMLRSLTKTTRIDPGFDTNRLVTATVSIYAEEDPQKGRRSFQELIDRIESAPWVRSASLTPMRPLTGSEYRSRLRLEGHDEPVTVYRSAVAPGYLATLGLKLLRGRALTDTDTADAPGVILVNEAFTRRYLDGREALGRRVWPGGPDAPSFEIVGVVQDARFLDLLTEPEPLIYSSFHQLGYSKRNSLLVRTEIDSKAALPALRAELLNVDPDVAVIDALTYADVLRGSTGYAYMNAEAFVAVGVLALLLVAAGVFGVISLVVSQRSREMGIRMAVGASRAAIFSLILGQVARAVGLGLALGLAAALGTVRLVDSLLFGVERLDAISFGTAVLTLVGVSLVAAGLPALRAARANPMTSLRGD